jgi:serine protease Do
MSHSFRRFVLLAVVGVVAFFIVSKIKQFSKISPLTNQEYHPEKYTLSDKTPLNVSDIELLSRLNTEYVKITDAVVSSVVSINTKGISEKVVQDSYGRAFVRRLPTQGQGSGVIVSREGHVITNHHVVNGQQQLEVKLHDGKSYSAKLIGEDPMTDIAVLKIDSSSSFEPLKFGNSDDVKVGQLVFAVGNPFGLGETITNGIISAKERSISDRQKDLFQTDAAINPGNSGGPLVNIYGEIVGINVAIFSSDRQSPGFQGVGFSIPGNDVKEVLEQILQRGRPVYSYLGVEMDGALENSSLKDVSNHIGCIIKKVAENSPAQKANLQPGDVIIEYEGEKIESIRRLITLVSRSKVGQEAVIGVMRSEQKLTVKATIAEYVEAEQSKNYGIQKKTVDSLGFIVRSFSSLEMQRGFSGVLVTEVHQSLNSPVIVNDIIIALNQNMVSNTYSFYGQLQELSGQIIKLTVIRDGVTISIDYKIS